MATPSGLKRKALGTNRPQIGSLYNLSAAGEYCVHSIS